jgi:hypothetical protein
MERTAPNPSHHDGRFEGWRDASSIRPMAREQNFAHPRDLR